MQVESLIGSDREILDRFRDLVEKGRG